MIAPIDQVVCEDCLVFLKSIPDESIDLIINDPPYFIGLQDPDGTKWDKQWKDEQSYLKWCSEWTKECVRILKTGRMLIVWGTLKKETFLRYKLETSDTHKNILYPQNEIVWSYNWGGRSKYNFARKHEYAFIWSKGTDFLFNADDIRVERKMKKNIRTGENFTKNTIPTCVWEQNNHTTAKDYINWHPTSKNILLTMRLIKAYSNKGDTVLDCFMGSATTAIAAMRTARHFTGSESHEEYFSKLVSRITTEKSIISTL